MRALQVVAHGDPAEVLELRQVPAPVPGPGQLRVRVGAAALNLPDVNLCRGLYHLRPSLPFTPGMEASGIVLEAGSDADEGLVGSRVVGVPELPNGALAEETILVAERAHRVPDGVDDATAAAMFIAFTTAHVALIRRARLQPGETLVVHAAAGGVGSAAVQLGRAIGAEVIAVSSSPAKQDVCRALGAGVVVDSSAEDVEARVLEATGGRGADVVFDPVGGEAFQQSTRFVALDGRILVVGFASGEIPEVRANHVLYRSYSLLGVYVGAYSRDRAGRAYLADVYQSLAAMLEAGELHPLISGEIALDGVAAALTDLADRRTVGKIIVRP